MINASVSLLMTRAYIKVLSAFGALVDVQLRNGKMRVFVGVMG